MTADLERRAARRAAWPRPAAVRDRGGFGTRVTYSPKVFIPLTMLCRDKCGYCTFAQPPARLDAPYLDARRGAGHRPGRRRGRLPRGAVHPGRAPRGALPGGPRVARQPTATPRPSTTWSAMARLVVDEIGLLPHANAGALFADELAALRAGGALAGDDDRVAQRATSRPTAARPTRRPSAAWPPSRRPASWPSRSPPASSSASASRGPIASPRSRPSPRRTGGTGTCRRSSSRTSCPSRARRCSGPGPARPTTTSRPSPWPA